VEGGVTASIVFDLDGTLIDSAPDICAIANSVLSEEGAAPLTLAEATSFVGEGAARFIERARAARGVADTRHADMLAAFVARYDTAHDLTVTYPGTLETLDVLHTAGHRMAICTNKPEAPARAVLAHFGLLERFDAVIGGDTLQTRKPDPEMLLAAFAPLSDGPRLYVGDSETDAETARRAGLPFLLFTEGYRKAAVADLPHAAAFSCWSDLPGLVAELLERPRL